LPIGHFAIGLSKLSPNTGLRLAISKRVDRVPTYASARIAAAAAVATAVGMATLLDARVLDDDTQALIQKVLAQTTRSGVAIRATRELRAGTVSGNHQGHMRVETAITPAGAFAWNVIDEGGSARTREKVFYELLKNEAETWRTGRHDDAALTPDNYQFTALPGARAGQTQIRLTPRRADARLVDGILTVNADGYPVRLEGKLAKSPSFWVKSVFVVKHFGRFGDVSLPTSIESLADVKIVGRSTFTMRYQYTEVNGRSVSHTVASTPFVGPSAEILALHASGSTQ
jgi:hypothetical protein